MRKFLIYTASITYMLALYNNIEVAAQSKRKIKATYRANPPKAILVELLTHQNKIDRYTASKKTATAAALKTDANKIIEKTVADFNTNFNFCPVYYFFDTNATKVLNRKFDGILLDKNLKPVKASVMNNNDTSYLIAVYGPSTVSDVGYPVIEDGAKNDIHRGLGSSHLISSYKLNLLNYSFTSVPQYIFYDNNINSFFRGKDYASKSSNISYRPSAKNLNKKMNAFYYRK